MTDQEHPPSALAPIVGESLSGYVRRFNATGLTPPLALPPRYADADLPPGLTDAVHRSTGLDAGQIRRMTMAGWPLILRGRGLHHRRGWALHRHDVWLCPSCTPLTGYRALRWRLALAPVCLRCHTLLTHERTFTPTRAATTEELARLRRLDELTTRALQGSKASRSHLSVLRRICAAGDAHEPDGDVLPRPPLGGTSRPAGNQRGTHPPGEPGIVMKQLATLDPALLNESRARAHLQQLQHQDSLPSSSVVAPAPFQPDSPTALALARARRRALLRQLTDLCAATGLRPQHIPTVVDPWRSTRWSRLRDLEDQAFEALALHTLLLEALGEDATGSAVFVAHGIPAVVNQHDLLTRVRTRGTLTPGECDRLLARAQALVDDGLVDYAYRRGTLLAVPSLPRIPAVHLPRHPFWPARTLVPAWAWVEYARGLPDSGPAPDLSLESVDRFHADLDPEARLRLLEAFDTHVRGEDWAAIASAAGSSFPTFASAHQRSA
ncbi:TniQ family protein [Micrococcus sp. 2A]|uniref:TniQ family protein n=1 Tax=Actinomycetes TaxID=1760 RepID=UPI001F2F8BF5|nr:TniQ family protein [Micrococcus yunnanensis]MCF8560567.1 TniQ family protein [Micrococcus yunnanensis]MCV7684970.1 TniQ family protein [Micrococcus luteus]MCV7732166.1 TniQ family protein [Micrococcus luteus]